MSRLMTTDDARRAYLHPGHLLVSREPIEITTVIGSCVAVCLWDRDLRFGGMNHFVLPGVVGGAPTLKHGEQAMNELILHMLNSGGNQRNLRARVFGGSCVIEAFRSSGNDLGSKNVQVARRVLAAHRIPIVQEEVGGTHDRKLVFHSAEGSVLVQTL
jgi:chemotaxis protein CheD